MIGDVSGEDVLGTIVGGDVVDVANCYRDHQEQFPYGDPKGSCFSPCHGRVQRAICVHAAPSDTSDLCLSTEIRDVISARQRGFWLRE